MTYHFLNALQEKYGGNSQCSLKVLGFPCGQFYNQEPGSNAEIPNLLRYVRPGNGFIPNFNMFNKIEVNGAKEDPIFTMLKGQCPRPNNVIADFPMAVSWRPIRTYDIHWNFEKFLVDHKGQPLYRYAEPNTTYATIEKHIEAAIQECQSESNVDYYVNKVGENMWREYIHT